MLSRESPTSNVIRQKTNEDASDASIQVLEIGEYFEYFSFFNLSNSIIFGCYYLIKKQMSSVFSGNMRIFLFNFSIFEFSNVLFCDKFCYLRTHTNIFQFLNLLGEVGFGKVILTLNIPNVTNPIAPWSAARTQREKYFQVVSQRNTSGQVCVFKMSPILKHSDHILSF